MARDRLRRLLIPVDLQELLPASLTNVGQLEIRIRAADNPAEFEEREILAATGVFFQFGVIRADDLNQFIPFDFDFVS